MKTYIAVRHNVEVAHRLYESQGKCENIHGHSMWVEMRIDGPMNEVGMLVNTLGKPLEFGEVKHGFRNYLDAQFDHHLLLNKEDPWAGLLVVGLQESLSDSEAMTLPGLRTCDGDPTTENIAMWLAVWAQHFYMVPRVEIHVAETSVNSAGVVLGGE